MSSTFETGHARNVSNFEKLVTVCQGFGPAYNPSTPAITMAQLTAKLTDARAAVRNAHESESNFKKVTNKRAQAFKPLQPLTTRMINALIASGASAEIIKDARTVVRKMNGQRATPKAQVIEAAVTDTPTPSPKTISVSQQSFDQKLEHFTKLITLLAGDSNYQPNETPLKITTLYTELDSLRNANTQVIGSFDIWENSRIHRDRVLYDPISGLTTVAQQVKSYIKAAFGASSDEYKKVEGLGFKTQKY